MDQKLENVLTMLIEDFIRTAEPIGSQGMVRDHGLDVSPATIRNWFAELEEEGYLGQPHTSAGRIPTQAAYRWYIEQMGEIDISKSDRKIVDAAETDTKHLAKACVEATGLAALVGMNASDTYYTGLTQLFSQPEFKDWSRVISMSSILDQLDHQLLRLRKQIFDLPHAEIGDSCPFGNACSSIFLTLPDASLLILLGPMRMDYKRAVGVMNYIKECV
ncbi:MAG: hypothetical protein WC477_01115 [Patescibacteria group bacterium]